MTDREYRKLQDIIAVADEIRSDISDARTMTTCFCFNDVIDIKKFQLMEDCYEAIFREIDKWRMNQFKMLAREESKL